MPEVASRGARAIPWGTTARAKRADILVPIIFVKTVRMSYNRRPRLPALCEASKTGLQMGPGKTRPELPGWGSGSEKTLENVTFERFSAAGRIGVRGLFSSKFGKSNLRSILELFGIAFGAFLVPLGALLERSCGRFGALFGPFGGGGGGQNAFWGAFAAVLGRLRALWRVWGRAKTAKNQVA